MVTEVTLDNYHTRNIDRTLYCKHHGQSFHFTVYCHHLYLPLYRMGQLRWWQHPSVPMPAWWGYSSSPGPPSTPPHRYHHYLSARGWALLCIEAMWYSCYQFVANNGHFSYETASACHAVSYNVRSGECYWMLPLTTCCHTHYQLHPFHFMLFMFQDLVAKQHQDTIKC